MAISVGVAFSVLLGAEHPIPRWVPILDAVVGLLTFVLVGYRRRWPMPIAVLLMACTAVSSTAAGPSTLAAVSLATRRVWTQVLTIGAMSVLAGEVYPRLVPSAEPIPWWVNTLILTALTTATLGWGMYIGSRRELTWTLRQRAERAEAEQELRAGQAKATERYRIAREMHDVLAHRISHISMHAGALAFRDDLGADAVRASAGQIQSQAHEALTELRGILGVLRDPDTGQLLDRPQPTYRDVAALVDEAHRSGLHVHLVDRVGAPAVPDRLGRTVYRIVQEAITNVGKHAPGAALSIQLDGSESEGISLRLANRVGFSHSAAPGAGLGLIGLAERAVLSGGRLEHHHDGRTFVVQGWLPWAR